MDLERSKIFGEIVKTLIMYSIILISSQDVLTAYQFLIKCHLTWLEWQSRYSLLGLSLLASVPHSKGHLSRVKISLETETNIVD